MLVQINISDVLGRDGGYVGTCYCTRCHCEIGVLSADELRHMVYSDDPNDILCFHCENIKPETCRDYTKNEKGNLLRIFALADFGKLPLHGSNAWGNPDIGAWLQLQPMYGWALWYPTPDGVQMLRSIRTSTERSLQLIDLFGMRPMCLGKKKSGNPSPAPATAGSVLSSSPYLLDIDNE